MSGALSVRGEDAAVETAVCGREAAACRHFVSSGDFPSGPLLPPWPGKLPRPPPSALERAVF